GGRGARRPDYRLRAASPKELGSFLPASRASSCGSGCPSVALHGTRPKERRHLDPQDVNLQLCRCSSSRFLLASGGMPSGNCASHFSASLYSCRASSG